MGVKIVAYHRVSTKRQGESGLGLDAQQAAVKQYAALQTGTISAEYTEVESGKRCDRPALAKAIAHAKRTGATLCIAKLDRLARNVHFVSGLMESDVNFVACDNMHANRLTIHILAAVAEDEAQRISERTRAALQAAKARGTLLGSARPGHWDGREHLRAAGLKKATHVSAVVRSKAAKEANAYLMPDILRLREEGKSLAEVAEWLNDEGYVTRKGCRWSKGQVSRVLKRLQAGR